jgi:hypothetical protein
MTTCHGVTGGGMIETLLFVVFPKQFLLCLCLHLTYRPAGLVQDARHRLLVNSATEERRRVTGLSRECMRAW